MVFRIRTLSGDTQRFRECQAVCLRARQWVMDPACLGRRHYHSTPACRWAGRRPTARPPIQGSRSGSLYQTASRRSRVGVGGLFLSPRAWGGVGDDYSFEVRNTCIISSLVRELDHCYAKTDLVRNQAELYLVENKCLRHLRNIVHPMVF
jgi:hypothetical protein